MPNAKFIPAADWTAAPEVNVTDGEDLFPQVAAGTYYPILSSTTSIVVPQLTAGSIAETSPSVGDTLTVTGSNATGTATFQWQIDTGAGFGDITGATSATFDTTGEPAGDYRRGVADGAQAMVYTPPVTVAAAPSLTYSALYADDFTSYSAGAEWSTLPDIGYISDNGILFRFRSAFDDLLTERSAVYAQSVVGYTGTIAGHQKAVAHAEATPGNGRFGLALRASPAATYWDGYIFLIDMQSRECGIYQCDDVEWRGDYTALGSTFTIPSLFVGQVFEFEVQVDGSGDHILTARVQETDGDPTLTEYTRNLGATPTYTSGAPGLFHQDTNSGSMSFSYVEFGEYA